MNDEYGALAMVLLRFLAFPPAPAGEGPGQRTRPERAEPPREGRAAPLRSPPPPAISLPLPNQPAALPGATSVPAVQAPMAVGSALASQPEARSAAVPSSPIAAEPAAPAFLPPETFATSATSATPAKPALVGTANGAALGERWHALVHTLCDSAAVTALARELATQGGLRLIDDAQTPPRWHLLVERETLRTPALRDKLTAALATALGHAVDLVLEAGTPTDSPARRDAAERLRLQAAAEAAIQGDAVVLGLLSQFKTARIVPGSIQPV
jgi:DNA polymerase-3 subunit gamma/tau